MSATLDKPNLDKPTDGPLGVYFVTSEAYPLVKVGGLGDVASALPKALAERGHDVRLFLPRYVGLPRQAPMLQLRVDAGRVTETFEVAPQGRFGQVQYYTVGPADGQIGRASCR